MVSDSKYGNVRVNNGTPNNNTAFSGFRSLLYLALLMGLSFSTYTSTVFAECNALCLYQRGDITSFANRSVSNKQEEYLFGPSYEIAQNTTDSLVDHQDEDEVIIAADDSKDNTIFIGGSSDKWRFSVTPYLWMVGINGDIGVRGQTVDLDVSFSDIIDNLDIGFQLHMEAWREKFGFFIDLTYSKITLKGDAQLRFDNSIDIKSITESFLGEFVGFYRLGTWPLGSSVDSNDNALKSSLTVDLLGGGRLWWMENTVKINGPVGILDPRFSGSDTWFDFIVGGRAQLAINKFFIALRSDVGGFDFGFSSDISWNIAGYIGYELPWHHITPILGYRALYDKYDSGSGDNRFLWDAWMYGPELGVAIPF